jgi:hypothetical protein
MSKPSLYKAFIPEEFHEYEAVYFINGGKVGPVAYFTKDLQNQGSNI